MNGHIDPLADKLGTPCDGLAARELSREVIHACAEADQIQGVFLVSGSRAIYPGGRFAALVAAPRLSPRVPGTLSSCARTSQIALVNATVTNEANLVTENPMRTDAS